MRSRFPFVNPQGGAAKGTRGGGGGDGERGKKGEIFPVQVLTADPQRRLRKLSVSLLFFDSAEERCL